MSVKNKKTTMARAGGKNLLTTLIDRQREQAPLSADKFPFVSIVTPSFNRRHFLPYLLYMFQYQDYPAHRRELVILDDSETSSQDLIDQLVDADSGENIRYIFSPKRLALGEKRNKLNELAIGEYIICMDDDDYYPADKISYTLHEMKKNRAMFSASGQIYIWYSHLNKIYKTVKFSDNFALNGTFACHRRFLKNHRYEDQCMLGEERGFLNDFTETVLQIAPEKSILCISHSANTFDKDFVMGSATPAEFTLEDWVTDKTLLAHYRRMSHAPVSQKVNWQAFEKIIVITESDDPEKGLDLQKQWTALGMSPSQLMVFPLHKHSVHAIAESQTHLDILTLAQRSGWKNYLLLSDDVQFIRQEKTVLDVNKFIHALQQIDWKVAMLGADHINISILNSLNRVVRINQGEVPCAYAVNQPYYSTLLKNYQQGLALLSENSLTEEYRLDKYWSSLMATDSWLALYPSFAYCPTLWNEEQQKYLDSAHRFFRKEARVADSEEENQHADD